MVRGYLSGEGLCVEWFGEHTGAAVLFAHRKQYGAFPPPDALMEMGLKQVAAVLPSWAKCCAEKAKESLTQGALLAFSKVSEEGVTDPAKRVHLMRTLREALNAGAPKATETTLLDMFDEGLSLASHGIGSLVIYPCVPGLDSKWKICGGDFGVVMAPSKAGKSWYGIHLLKEGAKQGYPGLYLSLELKPKQAAIRFLMLAEGRSEEELVSMSRDELRAAVGPYDVIFRFWPSFSVGINKIVEEIESWSKEGLVVLDYLTLLRLGGGVETYSEFSQMGGELVRVAAETRCAVVTAHQPNRAGYSDSGEPPQLHHAGASLGIIQHADWILAIGQGGGNQRNLQITARNGGDALGIAFPEFGKGKL